MLFRACCFLCACLYYPTLIQLKLLRLSDWLPLLWIRLAALAAILGGATRADSFADCDMAGAENALDASGGHVHGGAPPQLQTGGGTSPRLLALRLAHSSLDRHLSCVVFFYFALAASCALSAAGLARAESPSKIAG